MTVSKAFGKKSRGLSFGMRCGTPQNRSCLRNGQSVLVMALCSAAGSRDSSSGIMGPNKLPSQPPSLEMPFGSHIA